MNILNVGMGEIKLSNTPGSIIAAPGLGSCIGLAMYDPTVKLGGMAHIVLPDSTNINKPGALPGKYADLAVPELLNQMIKQGAKKNNIIIKMAGGAQMFSFEKGGNILNIGMRNTIAVKANLSAQGQTIRANDTGGNKGRTVRLDISTGKVYVKIIGQQEVEI